MSDRPSNSPDATARKQVAWVAAKRRGRFSYAELAAEVGASTRWIAIWSKEWEAEGLVRCIAGGAESRNTKRFEVLPEGEFRLEMRGDAIDQMWTVMRKSPQGFTPTDLLAQIAVSATPEEARTYCHTLLTAGYLRCSSKAVPKRREAVYRLVNATGIRAPRPKRLRCVVDPNTGKIIPMVEARHG